MVFRRAKKFVLEFHSMEGSGVMLAVTEMEAVSAEALGPVFEFSLFFVLVEVSGRGVGTLVASV